MVFYRIKRVMHVLLTLGKLPNISFILNDEMDPCGGVHDGPDAADAGELQKSVCNARASPSWEPVQGLQEKIQPTQLQELHHPCLVATFQATFQPRVVDYSGNLKQSDAQLWISTFQVGLLLGIGVLRRAQATPDCRPLLFPVWFSWHNGCRGKREGMFTVLSVLLCVDGRRQFQLSFFLLRKKITLV